MKTDPHPTHPKSKTGSFIAVGFILIGVIITILIYGKITSLQYSANPDTRALAGSNQIEDIPVFPQSELINSSTVPAGQVGFTATWASSSSVRDIGAWYSASLVTAGWITDIPDTGDSQDFSYIQVRKTDKYMQLSLVHKPGEGQTMINVKILPPLSDTAEKEDNSGL